MAAGSILILVAAMRMAVMPDACESQKVSAKGSKRSINYPGAVVIYIFIDLGAYGSFAKQIRVELFKSEEVLENLKLVSVEQGQYEKLLNSLEKKFSPCKRN